MRKKSIQIHLWIHLYIRNLFDRNMLVSRTNETGFNVTLSLNSQTNAIKKKASHTYSMEPFSDFLH